MRRSVFPGSEKVEEPVLFLRLHQRFTDHEDIALDRRHAVHHGSRESGHALRDRTIYDLRCGTFDPEGGVAAAVGESEEDFELEIITGDIGGFCQEIDVLSRDVPLVDFRGVVVGRGRRDLVLGELQPVGLDRLQHRLRGGSPLPARFDLARLAEVFLRAVQRRREHGCDQTARAGKHVADLLFRFRAGSLAGTAAEHGRRGILVRAEGDVPQVHARGPDNGGHARERGVVGLHAVDDMGKHLDLELDHERVERLVDQLADRMDLVRLAAAGRVVDPDQFHPVGPFLPAVHGDDIRLADLRASVEMQFDLLVLKMLITSCKIIILYYVVLITNLVMIEQVMKTKHY